MIITMILIFVFGYLCIALEHKLRIDKAAIRTHAVFGLLQAKGGIDEHDMFNTFNMGVGMIVVVSPETAEAALGALKAEGIDAYVCGEIVTGEEKVCLC